VQSFVFLIGFGGGVLNGATNALAADVSPGARGSRLSLLGVFFGIGAMTMPGTLALLSRHFPLSTIVSAIGLVTLVPVAWFLLIRFPPPKQSDEPCSLGRGAGLLKDPVFLLAGLALAVQSGMEGLSNDWMTRYFKHVTLAGQAAEEWRTQLGLLAVTGAMVGTRLALSRLLTRVPSQAVLFASIGITAIGALALMQGPGYAASLGAALCLGTGLAAAFPVVLSYIGDLYPARSGAAFSTLFSIALLGNMGINKTFGLLAQARGVGQYARVMLACLVISGILLGLVVQRLPGRRAASKDGIR
jgi:MFS family permease